MDALTYIPPWARFTRLLTVGPPVHAGAAPPRLADRRSRTGHRSPSGPEGSELSLRSPMADLRFAAGIVVDDLRAAQRLESLPRDRSPSLTNVVDRDVVHVRAIEAVGS